MPPECAHCTPASKITSGKHNTTGSGCSLDSQCLVEGAPALRRHTALDFSWQPQLWALGLPRCQILVYSLILTV